MDLSDFDCRFHAGVLLDGVADTRFLKQNREVLQGRPKLCKGGRSATMMYAYTYTLCRRAVVVTLDLSAQNLDLLRTDHWLSNSRNVLQLHLNSPAWQQDLPSAPLPPSDSTIAPRSVVKLMTASALHEFLVSHDLCGPAEVLRCNSVNGSDFLALSEIDFQRDLRMTPFASKKLVRFALHLR